MKIDGTLIDWSDVFRRSERSVQVQNRKPNHETARNIFAEDRKLIFQAAAAHGFQVFAPSLKHRAVLFFKP